MGDYTKPPFYFLIASLIVLAELVPVVMYHDRLQEANFNASVILYNLSEDFPQTSGSYTNDLKAEFQRVIDACETNLDRNMTKCELVKSDFTNRLANLDAESIEKQVREARSLLSGSRSYYSQSAFLLISLFIFQFLTGLKEIRSNKKD